MLDIKIASMELVHPLGADHPIKGTFAAILGPLRMTACAIVKNDDGTLIALMPKSRNGGKLVKFREHADFETFNKMALAAYAGLLRANGRKVDEGVEDAMGIAGLD